MPCFALRFSVPVSVNYHRLSPDFDQSSNNTSNNSLLNLFLDSDNVTPTPPPSPFDFGPLPPSPAPAMEIIMEVTETGTTSSENASFPETEIEILEQDGNKEVKDNTEEKPKALPEKKTSCQCGAERKEVKKSKSVDVCEKITEVANEERKIREYKNTIKQRKEDLKTFVDRHINDNEVFRRFIKEDEIFRKYIENEKLFRSSGEDEDVLSNSSFICDCPAHVHDKENPLELVKVDRDSF